ncbi:MAG: sensor histidine kinase, partial [Ignavibacteriales bacterium]
NIKYYTVKDLAATNIKGSMSFPKTGLPTVPGGYKYFWYFDGSKVWVVDNGKLVDTERMDSGYSNIIENLAVNKYPPGQLTNCRMLLAVSDDLESNPYARSMYYWERQILMIVGGVCIGLGVVALLLLVYAIIKRKDKREFDKVLASWSGKVWIEIKLLLSFLVLGLMSILFYTVSPSNQFIEQIIAAAFASLAFLILCWWFYLMLIDLIFNGSRFFSHNIINSVLKWYRDTDKMYPWQKSMVFRAYLLVVAEVVLAPISVLFLLGSGGNSGLIIISFLIAGLGLYLIYRYLRRFSQNIRDFGKLTDRIDIIKNGDMTMKLDLDPEADLYHAAQNLDTIQEGMITAVAEKTKSERMKMELITNVSHDLKTPLTSIISYVDLLGKEEDLPLHVNDYISILAQKSERLNNIVQDLFDLSKASSESIAMDVEKLDLPRLIKQTLADMEEQINASGLTFRLNLPDEPIYILSDGKKLYRVLENLITNALKYSLAGSRVFVDLVAENQQALITIKNTSNYEMNFCEEEILQRFVRGDESRSSEGSGLGLSIAQSFTQICGGRFSIKIDGDLFKAELQFNTLPKE